MSDLNCPTKNLYQNHVKSKLSLFPVFPKSKQAAAISIDESILSLYSTVLIMRTQQQKLCSGHGTPRARDIADTGRRGHGASPVRVTSRARRPGQRGNETAIADMGNRGHETAGTGHRGRGNGNGNGVTVTKQVDVIGLLVRILLTSAG